MTSSDDTAHETSADCTISSAVTVKIHVSPFDDQTIEFHSSDLIAVVPSGDKQTVDIVLWAPDALDEMLIRTTVRAYSPTPVLVILRASTSPTAERVSRCLDAGAAQCLIDPTEPELVAHIHATVRRIRRWTSRPRTM